jgi:purine-binding chemotaxis protein CheW
MTRTPTDWAEIHRRLAESGLAAEAPLGPKRRRTILEARARALAKAPPPAPGPCLEVLEFALGYERYAIATAWVREVHALRELTPLPGTPPFVLGIIHLRGQVLSVLDIKKFFDMPDRGISDLSKVIVLADATMEFGILADRVDGVRTLPLADLQPPPATLTDRRAEYLLGVTRDRDVVLDGRKLLNDPNIVVGEDAAR